MANTYNFLYYLTRNLKNKFYFQITFFLIKVIYAHSTALVKCTKINRK